MRIEIGLLLLLGLAGCDSGADSGSSPQAPAPAPQPAAAPIERAPDQPTPGATPPADQEQPADLGVAQVTDLPLCSCVWYTDATCPCRPESDCACERCEEREGETACLGALRRVTGTISGRLRSSILRRAPAAVYLVEVRGPSYRPPPRNPIIDQMNKVFIPHLLPVLVGSTVDFPNSDDVRHSVYSQPPTAKVFSLGEYAAGEVKRVTFDEVGEVSVAPLRCNIHVEMSAFVIVRPNPYFAVTDAQGGFAIPNVPPGTYEITFFHETLASKTGVVTVLAGETAQIEFADLQRK